MVLAFDLLAAITAQLSNIRASTDLTALTADELKTFMRLTSSLRQEADRVLACGSAEINQRSRRELGGAGMSKAEGFVNPESLIAALTGSTKADARKIDHLGKSLMEASPASSEVGATETEAVRLPWFAGITELMRSGVITPDRFEALRSGLGSSSETVPAEALAAAAERILNCLHPEDLPELVYRDAANARAFLDRAGVAKK